MKRNSFFLSLVISLCFPHLLLADSVREIQSSFTNQQPKIDGKVIDDVWKNVPATSDFTTYLPEFGKNATFKTEVKVLYDHDALFVSAVMFDDDVNQISKRLTSRDNFDNTDNFTVGLDPYNDNQNGYRFTLTAAGVQTDTRVSEGGANADYTWDAVWESAVSFNSDSWSVEIKIPWSAIRFPSVELQTWGIQFNRNIPRLNEFETWSPVNPNVSGILNQWGNLTGMNDLQPPMRLSLSPYIAAYYNHFPVSTNPVQFNQSTSVTGGMDLKLGLNESFTLDATLIPDFGQVQSDENIYNITAFEISYEDRRPFFTEGTELFNKSELFYSRRIGGTPDGYYSVYNQLQPGEEVIDNPSSTQLYNASKLSGRTNGGLGVGILNAVAAPVFATIKNEQGEERKVQTGWLTNYNVLVLDQNLKNNSTITFTNLSTMRNGMQRDADVANLFVKLKNKNNTYSVNGGITQSFIFENNTVSRGFIYNAGIHKISGNFLFDAITNVKDDKLEINDLGFLDRNNKKIYDLTIGYQNYELNGKVSSLSWFTSFDQSYLYKPNVWEEFYISSNLDITYTSNFSYGLNIFTKPFAFYDYYEPRVWGEKYYHTGFFYGGGYILTNTNKPVFVKCNIGYGESKKPKDPYIDGGIAPSFNINDHLVLSTSTNFTVNNKDYGFTDFDTAGNIIFAQRDLYDLTNAVTVQYNFNSKMNLKFHVRDYYFHVHNRIFYYLNHDGSLTENNFSDPFDLNVNIFNIDLIYSWQIAPGSYLNLIWKNNFSHLDNASMESYMQNISKTVSEPQTNLLSMKLIYYLDYNSLFKTNKS